MYEDEFELTFDTPEEEPVYEPEKASAAPAPVPEIVFLAQIRQIADNGA